MQQMTNALLSNTGNTAANSAKISSQTSNNDDFSSTLSSVSASSHSVSSAKKKPVNLDEPSQITSKDKSVDEDKLTDSDDVNLIFAQIDMANGMKKAASDGDSLPLALLNSEDANEATLDAHLDELSTLLVDASWVLSVTANVDQASVPTLVTGEVEFTAELQRLVTTVPDVPVILVTDNDVKQASLVDHSLMQKLPIEPNIIAVSDEVDVVINELASSTKVGVSLDESLVEDDADSDAVINQAVLADDITMGSIINTLIRPIVSTFNNSEFNNLNVSNIIASGNTLQIKASDVVASESVNAESTAIVDLNADSDAAASLLLKDAKLTVAMDISRDNNLIDDDSSFSDLKPASSTHGLSLSQLNRQETVSVQLSLRQGVEQQNQMQEMIQRFSPVMRQQLITMVSQGIQHAEIRLDPPELGHMLVKIQVHGDQTQVQFHVTQSQTRDLVEQAMPRLRELLQDQGMQLADSHVSQGDQGHPREGNFGDGDGSNHTDMDEIAAEELDLVLNQTTSINSGIDYYA
ncbi:flagellar hook-length control protein FliK [Shewanella morhuae]|uniref:flagellar hook-length control protein FliK n=1 Tax=Shewanella morhuae TaxID=365591 RepID=UPI001BBA211C|nr:flagellar hook-length control protein FliK [Shewanella morhuae]GIU03280.1 flagellar hook-length control protein FliK [Shewanella morhuae]